MTKITNKKFFVYFMVYLSILLTMTSTWVNNVFNIPLPVNRVFTALIYLPFLLAIFVKLIQDAKEYKSIVRKPIECIYYLLAVYYVIITGYRFLNGMEVKENLYYSIIFFGSIAIYLLIRSGKIKISKLELAKNLLFIDVFFVLYRLAYCLIGAHFIENQPININLTSGAVAILTPVVGNWLINECLSKRNKILYWLTLCSNIVVVLTTGSRAIFFLVAAIVLVLLICNLNNIKGLVRALSSIFVAIIVVVFLAMANVGEVRYSIYRQTGLQIQSLNIFDIDNGTEKPGSSMEKPGSSMEKPGSSTEKPGSSTEKPDSNKENSGATIEGPSGNTTEQQATEQISASDRMRKDLIQYGIEQVKRNPWIGTGDVEYYYQITEEYGFKQSSHNFLIEAIICYGSIGLLIIASLFIALIVDVKLFANSNKTVWKEKMVLLLAMLFYFAFGFVQPTVFNYIICPLFILVVAVCREALLGERNNQDVPEQK